MFEVRPWVADNVIDWMPSVVQLLAASMDGARALLPIGTKLRHVDHDDTEWWSASARAA